MLNLAPSLLAADFKRLEQEVAAVERAGARYLHLDVMDGTFVPSISFGMPVIESLRSCSGLIFDVHMMVEEPGRYVEDMVKAGADIISVHAEACTHLARTISQIHEQGVKAGVVLNPATPLNSLEWVLDEVDLVLIMSVNPGFGGQKFIPNSLEKIKRLRRMCDERGLHTDIQVDGGVKLSNAASLIEAGANILVAGSAVFGDKTEENTKAFLELLRGLEG